MKQEAIKQASEYVVETPPSLLSSLKSWLRATGDKLVPTGYQDETGFHLGKQPDPKGTNYSQPDSTRVVE